MTDRLKSLLNKVWSIVFIAVCVGGVQFLVFLAGAWLYGTRGLNLQSYSGGLYDYLFLILFLVVPGIVAFLTLLFLGKYWRKGVFSLGVGLLTSFIVGSFILSLFNSGPHRAGDSRIKGDLAGARVQAELYFDSHRGTYGSTTITASTSQNACSTHNTLFDPSDEYTLYKFLEDANNAGPLVDGWGITCALSNDPTAYAISAALKDNKGKHWCIDSTGAMEEISEPIVSPKCL